MKRFFEYFISVFLDISLLLLFYIFFVFGLSHFIPENKSTVLFYSVIPLCLFFTYILFKDVFYPSLGAFIMRYRLRSNKKIRILISNCIEYSLWIGFIVSTEENVFYIIKICISVLLLIQLIPLFIPKIGVNMSYYVLRIKKEYLVKKIINDGIIL